MNYSGYAVDPNVVEKLKQQITNQRNNVTLGDGRKLSTAWTGGAGYDFATQDMAQMLAASGITSIDQVGLVKKPVPQTGMAVRGIYQNPGGVRQTGRLVWSENGFVPDEEYVPASGPIIAYEVQFSPDIYNDDGSVTPGKARRLTPEEIATIPPGQLAQLNAGEMPRNGVSFTQYVDAVGNKETNKPLIAFDHARGGTDETTWGSTTYGKDNTYYKVAFDKTTGLPLFYTLPKSKSDSFSQFVDMLKGAAPVLGIVSMAVPGMGQTVGSTLLNAVGATNLAANAAIAAGVGSAVMQTVLTGSPKQGILNALGSYAGSAIGSQLGGLVDSPAAKKFVNDVSSAAMRSLIRGDNSSEITQNALTASLGSAVNLVMEGIPSFSDSSLSNDTKSAIRSAVTIAMQGDGNLADRMKQAALNGAIEYGANKVGALGKSPSDVSERAPAFVSNFLAKTLSGKPITDAAISTAIQQANGEFNALLNKQANLEKSMSRSQARNVIDTAMNEASVYEQPFDYVNKYLDKTITEAQSLPLQKQLDKLIEARNEEPESLGFKRGWGNTRQRIPNPEYDRLTKEINDRQNQIETRKEIQEVANSEGVTLTPEQVESFAKSSGAKQDILNQVRSYADEQYTTREEAYQALRDAGFDESDAMALAPQAIGTGAGNVAAVIEQQKAKPTPAPEVAAPAPEPSGPLFRRWGSGAMRQSEVAPEPTPVVPEPSTAGMSDIEQLIRAEEAALVPEPAVAAPSPAPGGWLSRRLFRGTSTPAEVAPPPVTMESPTAGMSDIEQLIRAEEAAPPAVMQPVIDEAAALADQIGTVPVSQEGELDLGEEEPVDVLDLFGEVQAPVADADMQEQAAQEAIAGEIGADLDRAQPDIEDTGLIDYEEAAGKRVAEAQQNYLDQFPYEELAAMDVAKAQTEAVPYDELAAAEVAEAQQRTGGGEDVLYQEEAAKDIAQTQTEMFPYDELAAMDVAKAQTEMLPYDELAALDVAEAQQRTGGGEDVLYQEDVGKILAEEQQDFLDSGLTLDDLVTEPPKGTLEDILETLFKSGVTPKPKPKVPPELDPDFLAWLQRRQATGTTTTPPKVPPGDGVIPGGGKGPAGLVPSQQDVMGLDPLSMLGLLGLLGQPQQAAPPPAQPQALTEFDEPVPFSEIWTPYSDVEQISSRRRM